MKKLALLLTLALVLVACKSDNKESESVQTETETQANSALRLKNNVNDGTKQIKGEFIYVEDGAVLKGSNFIYGVELNDLAEELKNRVEPVKKDVYDMVPVTVRGRVSTKKEGADGWDEIVTITEILNVSNTPAEADIKIEDKKN